MCEPSASASHGGVHILLILVNEAFSLTTLLSVVLGFCLFVFYWLSSQERADLALFHTLSCTFWSSVMYIQGSEFLFLLLEVPYCLFIHTELGQQHHNSWMKLTAQVFSLGGPPNSPSCLGILDSTSALHVGAFQTAQSPMGNVAMIRPQRRHLFTLGELKQETVSCLISAGSVCQFTFLGGCKKAPSIDWEVQINCSK